MYLSTGTPARRWRRLALLALLPAGILVLVAVLWPRTHMADAANENTITPVDTAGFVGTGSSVALNGSGDPVVSYADGTGAALKVLVCGNSACTAGNTITAVDSGQVVGTSLALDALDRPIVAYHDSSSGDLKILACGNMLCTSGNTISSPDTVGNVGLHASLVLDGAGNPVVSYFDMTNGDLKILHCGNPTCTTGNHVAAVDTVGTVGGFTSLQLDGGGLPAISYFDYDNVDLKIVRCGDMNCSAGNVITAPVTAGSVGLYSSLALDPTGIPVVSYQDIGNNTLGILRCGNATCSLGNSVVAPDGPATGAFTSLRLDSASNPVVSYQHHPGTLHKLATLRVLRCGNTTCTAGNSIADAHTGGDRYAGGFTSLVLDAFERPIVSYTTSNPFKSDSDLWVLHCGTTTCLADAKPTPTPTATRTPCPAGKLPLKSECGTPTATLTPVIPAMKLTMAGEGVQCDNQDTPSKCSAHVGQTFIVSISLSPAPPQGYLGFQTELIHTGLAYLDAPTAAAEITWPDGVHPLRNVKADLVHHGDLTALQSPFPLSSYEGEVVRLSMLCEDPGDFKLLLDPFTLDHQLGSSVVPHDGLGNPALPIPVSDSLQINCVVPPTPTATPTPIDVPQMQKLPALQNLFLTRQGTKIPPVQCAGAQGGDDGAVLVEQLSIPIGGTDPKDPTLSRELGGFSFEVQFNGNQVCVELEEGPAWQADPAQVCTVEDAVSKPTLQNKATIHCVTLGKTTTVDTNDPVGRILAVIRVKPQPGLYSEMKANQDNGHVLLIRNEKCKLTDLQGVAIGVFSCDDASVTIRFLEGDVEPDCQVSVLDTQQIAFRWGATKGQLLYLDRFNLEPSGHNSAQSDNDIDVNDLQFVFGRFGSSCSAPHPPQAPLNAGL